MPQNREDVVKTHVLQQKGLTSVACNDAQLWCYPTPLRAVCAATTLTSEANFSASPLEVHKPTMRHDGQTALASWAARALMVVPTYEIAIVSFDRTPVGSFVELRAVSHGAENPANRRPRTNQASW